MAKPFATTKQPPLPINIYFPAVIIVIHAGECKEGVTLLLCNSEVENPPSLTYPAQAVVHPCELCPAFMVSSVD